MKKGIIFSIILITLGVIFECLYFFTDINILQLKLGLLGIICTVAGVIGLIWKMVLPVLEKRALTLGKFKKKSISKNAKK